MDAVNQAISKFCQSLEGDSANLYVAYSGGMDSHVLLHALAHCLSAFPNLNLSAIHINHQLQDGSDDWAIQCKNSCDALEVLCSVIRVDVDSNSGLSPEQAARDARYQAIGELLNASDYLLTAHHQEDQAETVILQLMRGAGVSGLSAMSHIRDTAHYIHARPLLSLSQQSLKEYAEKHSLGWINDPTNQDTDIRRNYVRHEVLPRLRDQWPAADKLISTSASYLENNNQLTDWYLSRDLREVLDAEDVLSLNRLNNYPTLIQEHLIRHWYQSLGLSQPGKDKLAVIFNEVINARQDAQPALKWQTSQLIRSKNRLVLLPLWPQAEQLKWHGETQVTTNLWSLSITLEEGFDRNQLSISQGDYNISLEINGVNRRLKDLFKDNRIPPLMRPLVPVIYYQGEVVLIPAIYTDEKFNNYEFDFYRFGTSTNPSRPPLISVLSND